VRHIRIHDLRHSFVSNLIGAGVPIETIAKASGHASTGVTFRTYGHLLPPSQSEMAQRLANSKKARLSRAFLCNGGARGI